MVIYSTLVVFTVISCCLPQTKIDLHDITEILWRQALNTYNGSWIYNCLCNQWLSPRTLRVRTPLRRCVLDTTLFVKVCQSLATGRWFPPVSYTNKIPYTNLTQTKTYNIHTLIVFIFHQYQQNEQLRVPLTWNHWTQHKICRYKSRSCAMTFTEC